MPRGSASMRGTWAVLLVLLCAPTAFAGWKLLFRQKIDEHGILPLFTTKADVLSVGTETSNKYSILGTLNSADHKGGDGKFLFNYSDGDRTQVWKQSYDFVAAMQTPAQDDTMNENSNGYDESEGNDDKVPGYEPVDVADAGCCWAGLIPGKGDTQAWFDGSRRGCTARPGSTWWWAVGSTVPYNGQTIPGICGHTTTVVELYVYVYDGKCLPGQFPNETAKECQLCPEDTFSDGKECTPCSQGSVASPGSESCFFMQPGWNLIFKQTFAGGNDPLPFGDADAASNILFYGASSADPNFSRLKYLERFKGSNGAFTLKYIDGQNTQVWRQTSNFVAGEVGEDGKAEGYVPISIASEGCGWANGLIPTEGTNQAWFDGTSDSLGSSKWWWAVGSKKSYSGGTIPGTCFYETTTVQVLVENFVGYCAPGWYVDSAWCAPCPVNKFTNDTQVNATECNECPPLTYAWTGSSECAPIAPTGGWVPIFKNSYGSGAMVFKSWENLLSYGKEADDDYSRLQDLEGFRNYDGKFTFKYEDSANNVQEWRQTLNFMTSDDQGGTTGVDGYEAVSVSEDGCNWGGLQKSVNTASWIDGSNGNLEWKAYGGKLQGSCQHTVDWVKLSVYIFPGYCPAGSRINGDDGGAWCIKCPRNHYTDDERVTDGNCTECVDGTYSMPGSTEVRTYAARVFRSAARS